MTNRGFLPWIERVSECYAELEANDREGRFYCLQLDSAAWTLYRAAPQDWRERDAQYNDYFTDERFLARQLDYAPPQGSNLPPKEEWELRRMILRALAVARDRAFAELLTEPEEE